MKTCPRCGDKVQGRICNNCGHRMVDKQKHPKDKKRNLKHDPRDAEDEDESG